VTAAAAALAVPRALAGSPAGRVARALSSFQEAYAHLDPSSPERVVFVQWPLTLVIGLMVEQDSITASGRSAFRVRAGERTFPAAAGERWTARRIASVPARIDYLPIVATFPPDQEDRAQALARSWRDRGYESAVLPAGSQLVAGERPAGAAAPPGPVVVNDNRRLYVWVGRFTDEAAARRFLQTLIDMGERPWLLEKLVERQRGTMALVDPAGSERARASEIVWECDQPIKVLQVHHDVGFPQEGREDREYEGAIRAVFDKRGLVAAVNWIELDRYLRGVVPSEVPASDPAATIRAQAVAARGETLSGLGVGHSAQPYDLCSDQNCQVYTGLKLQRPSTTEAVDATRGEVLKRGARILDAVYSDTCGGHTENVENVWSSPPDPSLAGLPDSAPGQSGFPSPLTEDSLARWLSYDPPCWCRGREPQVNPKFRWTLALPAAELDARVNRVHRVGHVRALVPVERGVSGRLKVLRIEGTDGQALVYKELPIRKALGGLKSGLFVAAAERDATGAVVAWTIRGAGHGHGVGMCQVGARWAARAGKDYKAILAHYFQKSAVVKLYE
jgi:SpoIID/LytB domain protein